MLYRIIRKIYSYWDRMSCIVVGYYLRSVGISVGKNIKAYGFPQLSLFKGAVVRIGDNVTLRSRCRGNAIGINHRIVLTTHSAQARIEIGNHVGMSGGAICCREHIKIGDNTLLGANTIIADSDMHPVEPENRRYNNNPEDIPSKPVNIGKNVWIGADVFVCKGVSIGDNSVIGAMSVVTRSIPENCIAAGNPARIIREL